MKHLSELVKCFVFIYKALNHQVDPNKLHKCTTVKGPRKGSGRCPAAYSSALVVDLSRGPWACELGLLLLPPAAQVWNVFAFRFPVS